MESIVFSVVAHLPLVIFLLILLVLVYRWLRLPEMRTITELHLVATIVSAALLVASYPVLPMITRLLSTRYDLYVFQLDCLLGYRDFWMGKFVFSHPWTELVINVDYNLIISFVLGVFAYYLLARPLNELQIFMRTMILNFSLAIPIYLMVPVCGPRYVFATFPNLPSASVVSQVLNINAPPNGIPSVHMSTALLVLWFLRRPLWGKAIGLTNVILTIAATLGGGEHYIFDLICAVPYTMLLIYLGGARLSSETALNEMKAPEPSLDRQFFASLF